MKMFFLIIFYCSLLAISQLFFKSAMNQVGGITLERLKDFFPLLAILSSNPFLIAGIVFSVFAFCFWLIILSWLRLSYAFPLQAMKFIFVILLSWVVLKESIDPRNWIAIFFILVGILIMGQNGF